MSAVATADVIARIARVLERRKGASAEESYSAALYRQGDDAILDKIAEEAAELIEAASGADRDHVVREMADLWFHCQVLLAHKGIAAERLFAELERRFGTSGHDEKRSRNDRDARDG